MSALSFRLFLLLFFIFCVAFISSCKQKWDYTREMVQLDSISTLLISAERNLLAIDTGYFRVSYNSTAQYLNSIKESCFNDTLQKNTAIFLSDVYHYSGNVHYLLDSSDHLEKLVKESKQRLGNLKYDLTQNLIDKNNAKEYIAHERREAQRTTESILLVIEKAKLSCEKLDSMKTRISALADNLKLK